MQPQLDFKRKGITLRKVGHDKGGIVLKIPEAMQELIDIAKQKIDPNIVKICDVDGAEYMDTAVLQEGIVYFAATDQE